jgi:glycine/D-amino acid oxidase-like deaminating enzyme
MQNKVIIVGSGIFGLTSAWELQKRGHSVILFDPGPIPHPDASSTDISKVIRMDYGADEFYMQLMEECLERWRTWNKDFGELVFHETGVLFLTKNDMHPEGYEYESYQLLEKRGHSVDRLNSTEISKRFPAWNTDIYTDGYYNPQGGWSPSGRVVSFLADQAKRAGTKIIEGTPMAEIIEQGGSISGVRARSGEIYEADNVIVAAGTWTPHLLPQLNEVMRSIAQPVFHFQPENPALFRDPQFPVWTADIGNSGWYGFPPQDDGRLKIANHGPGWALDPNQSNQMPEGSEHRFRDFLGKSLPSAQDFPIISERLCFYCDTFDGDLWIGRDPERKGLIVSSGGSGHAFKFAPMLGELTADVLEGAENEYAHRFAWRNRAKEDHEAARYVE